MENRLNWGLQPEKSQCFLRIAGYFKQGSNGWMHIPVMDYYWRWSLFCNCRLQKLLAFVIPSEMLVSPFSLHETTALLLSCLPLGLRAPIPNQEFQICLKHCHCQRTNLHVDTLRACRYTYKTKTPAWILNANLARTKHIFGSPLPSNSVLIHKPFFVTSATELITRCLT